MRLPALLLAALVAFALFATAALIATPARADTLSELESMRLGRGETVIREHTWAPGASARYVGGVTYTIVDAAAADTYAILENIESYRRVLPRTKRVRLLGIEPNGDRLIELASGNSLMEAEYTLRVRHYPARREVRFWLETARPHEIDDAFGYFRLEPAVGPSGEQRVLLTYAILVDVGPGIIRDLFEDKVRWALLSVPQLVRRYVAEVRHP